MKLVALVFAAIVAVQDGGSGKIEWTKDVANGLEQAQKSGKPVMLYFTADW